MLVNPFHVVLQIRITRGRSKRALLTGLQVNSMLLLSTGLPVSSPSSVG